MDVKDAKFLFGEIIAFLLPGNIVPDYFLKKMNVLGIRKSSQQVADEELICK